MDNPTNLPSIQNKCFTWVDVKKMSKYSFDSKKIGNCFLTSFPFFGILHFFPLANNPLNSGTIYGTLYYLPHLLPFQRNTKKPQSLNFSWTGPGPDGYPLPDPTRTFFSYPNRTRNFFQNFRGQGSNYICYY